MKLASLVSVALIVAACSGTPTLVTSTTSVPTTVTSSTTTTTTTVPTTTAPPTTTTPERPVGPGDVDGTVGYVGCSMSQNAVEGYETLGGTGMWSSRAPYGGGSIGRWIDDITSDRGRYWDGFEDLLESHPDTTTVWLNLCTVRQNSVDSYESAVALIDEISTRIPGATIYVSAQPAYTDGHSCGLAGERGPEVMAEITAQLAADGVALPGPTMGPLAKDDTRDGCHASEPGQQILGSQLLEFFG